ncbi:MAG: flap endonuclease [Gammaproteobacteria bacterium]|nr:flap endonuclease [Gammaproteobacteria bacterium]MDD9960230.1 flap endonuclease [Gammaproteobacteria bacterium]
MVNENPQVYLVDASIYIFQAHFSPFVECYDEHGEELSALYGFTQFLLQFVRRTKPKYLAVAHDESLFCGFRHELCPEYKSNRELPDENLEMQLKGCGEICSILGLSSFASKVYEADDIIGTLAQSTREADPSTQVTIVSKDKDLAQILASEHDCLWDYSGNKRRYVGDIVDEFGVHPRQFPDYLGLIGDSVDCISGVPGVGPVKAKALLQEYRDMDEIYANLEKIPELGVRGAKGLAQALADNRALAALSKELATIVCQITDSEEQFAQASTCHLQLGEPDKDSLVDFLSQYRFRESDRKRLLNLANSLTSQ